MGAGLRGGRRVLVAAAGGAIVWGWWLSGLSSRFVSCTCEVWDTPFACSVSGWVGVLIWMDGGGVVTIGHCFFAR